MNRVLALALLLLASGTLAQGQQGSPAPPEVWASVEKAITPPARSAWRLDFRALAGRVKNPNLPDAVAVESTRWDNVQRDVIHWEGGRTTEAWTIDGVYLAEDFQTGRIFFDLAAGASARRIGVVSWVSPQNFSGVKESNGKSLAIFEGAFPLMYLWPGHLTSDIGGGKPNVLAVVSVEDGLLLAARIDHTEARFSWLPEPSGQLVPPPAFAKKYAALRQGIRAAAPPPKP